MKGKGGKRRDQEGKERKGGKLTSTSGETGE